MSLETWKKEFYKVPASTDMPELEAVEHSLLKWRGLQKTYLNKHGLENKFRHIRDDRGDILAINSDTCALCFKFYSYGADECRECPLVKAGFAGCESSRTTPAYIKWVSTSDPGQMIQELRATLKLVKEGGI